MTEHPAMSQWLFPLMKAAAALYLILLPGWTLTRFWSFAKAFDFLERFFISILLGICFTTLLGFALLRVGSNQLLRDFILAMLGLNLLLLLFASFLTGLDALVRSPHLYSLCALVAATAALFILPSRQPVLAGSPLPFSEFYIFPQGEAVGLHQSKEIDSIISLGITNHFPHDNQYRIEATSGESRLLYLENLHVPAGTSWQGELVLSFTAIDGSNAVDLMLYSGEQRKPVASLRLWRKQGETGTRLSDVSR